VAYCTLAQVRSYVGIGSTEIADDVLIAALIVRAQQAIDTYCDRTFEASADSTRYFDVGADTEGRTLWLDEDLCAITTVTNGDSSSTVITSSQYTTIPRNTTPYHGIRILASSAKVWEYQTDPEGALSVAGKWAYSTTAPADITHACIRLTAFLYRQKDTNVDADRPILTDAGVTIMPASLPNDVRQMLNPYRRL